MATWTGKSRGLWADSSVEVTAEQLTAGKYDFLITKHGTALHKNVSAAAKAQIPCVLFYEANPGAWDVLDETRWADERNIQLNEIIGDIFYDNTAIKRGIHGVMVDASIVNKGGTKFSGPWIKTNAQHLLARVWARVGLPNYLYINQEPIMAWLSSAADKENLFQLVKGQGGMSTATFVASANGYPADGTKPVMQYNNPKWFFWLFKDLGGGKIEVVYNGDKTTLYKELSFSGSGTVTPPTPTEPTEPTQPTIPANGDVAAQVAALRGDVAALQSTLNALVAAWNKTFKS